MESVRFWLDAFSEANRLGARSYERPVAEYVAEGAAMNRPAVGMIVELMTIFGARSCTPEAPET